MNRYKVSEYEKQQWKFQKLVSPGARQAERTGEERWCPEFGSFAEDVFHRMVADEPTRLEGEPGAEVWDRLHDEIDCLPEVDDLRARCLGDEDAAGIAATCIIDTLTAKVGPPLYGPLADVAASQESIEALERLVTRSVMTEQEEQSVGEVMDELLKTLQIDINHHAQHAANMDATDVRDAVRSAVKLANHEIDERDQAAAALTFGRAAHSGRQERKALGREAASLVRQNGRMKRIAQMAGRLKTVARAQQARKPTHGADEYTGVELGADLERLLPAEWVAADDPDLEGLFSARYLDRSLQQIELAAKPKKESGPIVILLDSSGSMTAGEADIWAAAVALAFLDIAAHQNRACAILHFGSSVLRTDLFEPGKVDPKRIVEAVSFFAACGGTSFEAALAGGLDIIAKQKTYKNADIIMITDGYSAVGSDLLSRVNNARSNDGLHVYSILIGMEPAASCNKAFSDEVIELGDVMRDEAKMHGTFGAV